jgi:hypothetical protein
MLKLNPNDNQGIRYVLAGCLLRRDNDSELKELLAAHEDGSAFWLYTRALVAFRESGDGDEQAAALVRRGGNLSIPLPAAPIAVRAFCYGRPTRQWRSAVLQSEENILVSVNYLTLLNRFPNHAA